MLTRLLILTALGFASAPGFPLPPRPALLLSGAWGYTHYSPDDLNEVNRIFEERSRTQGFGGYSVAAFNGHTESVIGIGAAWKRLQITLESEIWNETFSQRNKRFSSTYEAGTVNADENYLFIPTVLIFRYPLNIGRLTLLPGYGPGLMLGAATVDIRTTYTSGRENDAIHLDLTTRPTLIHRLGLDAYYRIKPWLSLGLGSGYRFSVIPYLEVAGVDGNSYIFDKLFMESPEEGERLYTVFGGLIFDPTSVADSNYHQIEGNLSGFYLWLKMVITIGGLL